MSKIPITRPWLGEQEAEAARCAILSGWVAQGPRVADFEQLFAQRVGAKWAVAVSSCTTGLHLALVAAGIGQGEGGRDQEVIVPSLSFIATANSVVHAGATPVFADVTEQSQNLSVDSVAAAITSATRAVIVAHQVGEPADLDALGELCKQHGLLLIEDAACAIGSTYRARPIGGHGNPCIFSFHPRKILTTGEGGMVVCDDEQFACRLRRLRNHAMSVSASERAAGRAARVTYDEVGFNFRMTDIQAAVGIVQLDKLDVMLGRRREQARRYNDALSRLDLPLQLPPSPSFGETNYQSYTLKLAPALAASRDAIVAQLQSKGVGAIGGIVASHLELAYGRRTHSSLPHTVNWASSALMLPIYHEMTDTQQDRVAAELGDVLKRTVSGASSRSTSSA